MKITTIWHQHLVLWRLTQEHVSGTWERWHLEAHELISAIKSIVFKELGKSCKISSNLIQGHLGIFLSVLSSTFFGAMQQTTRTHLWVVTMICQNCDFQNWTHFSIWTWAAQCFSWEKKTQQFWAPIFGLPFKQDWNFEHYPTKFHSKWDRLHRTHTHTCIYNMYIYIHHQKS